MIFASIQYALLEEVEEKQLHSLNSTSVKYIGLLSKEFHSLLKAGLRVVCG